MYLPTVQELFPPYTCDCVHLGSKDLLPCSRENDGTSLRNFASSPSDFVKALCFLSVCCFLIPWLVLFLNNSMSFVPTFDMRCGTLNNPSSPLVTKSVTFILESIILQLFWEKKTTKQNNVPSIPKSTWLPWKCPWILPWPRAGFCFAFCCHFYPRSGTNSWQVFRRLVSLLVLCPLNWYDLQKVS